MLYNKVISFLPEDEKLVSDFLHIEYDNEKLYYPFEAPDFDEGAALWAAKTLYLTCQLILYREHKVADLRTLLIPYNEPITDSAMLSADLCLRFLPQALRGTKAIDPDDALISIVEQLMQPWHYSTIGYDNTSELIAFETIENNACLLQLYTDRVIDMKDLKRAAHPAVLTQVNASLGMYRNEFWKELNVNNHE